MDRRAFVLKSSAATVATLTGLPALSAQRSAPDHTVEIGPCTVEASPKHIIKTVGYNGTVPGPLIRLREGRETRIRVVNKTADPEIVHWHGLHSPVATDGAMDEGSPMIAPGQSAEYVITPRPSGFRWYHTHTFAGGDLRKAQYSGQHGFLFVDSGSDPGAYDQEVFLGLHDWKGYLTGSGDGSMNPAYDVCTINGRMLGFGDPIRVGQGQRLLLHILNSSPTEIHWLAFPGHSFQVIALDGNQVPTPRRVEMLRLAPAERVCAVVELTNPGVWVLGEVRKHVQGAGMGIVVEYANAAGPPVWQQPQELVWNYEQFGSSAPQDGLTGDVEEIPLVLDGKFRGHGAMEQWTINGKSYPHTDTPVLTDGRRYRLRFINKSADEHPMHLHRHTFELKKVSVQNAGAKTVVTAGILKDTVLVGAGSEAAVEFTANNPGSTLLHCHQQNHMDLGFMMLFRYA